MLADKEDFPSGQKNPAMRERRNIIDNLFDKNKVFSESKPEDNSSDRSKATDDKAKKLSLMQDLFGGTLHVSSSKESNISKKSLQSEYEVTQATEVPKVQSQHSIYAPTAFGTREPRRGKRTSEIINDPLGLFASSTISNQTEQTVNV